MIRKLLPGLILFASLSMTLFTQNALETYQKGLVQEQTQGKLREAIQLYERAAKDSGKDRALAAKALIHAAGCYEKLGEPKAAELYAEVIQTYPEQRESVAAAHAALAAKPKQGASQSLIGLPSRLAAQLAATVTPVISNSCVGCHNQTRSLAGLALDTVTGHFVAGTPDFSQDAAVWEKVITRLRTHAMPPGHPLDDATNAAVISLLESALDAGYPTALAATDRVSDTELATRLAAFLWSDKPDATLTDLAAHGRLHDPAVLDQQVKRMISDSRSDKLVANAFSKWLRLDNLSTLLQPPSNPNFSAAARQNIMDSIARGKALYPDRTEESMQAMRHETELFISDQLHQDRPALELWTANYSFINDQLASLYGTPNITGSQFRRVTFEGDRRAGLLGQASILTATSFAERTSPIIRGKYVWSVLLGVPIPPPAPNVPLLDQTPAIVAGRPVTLRERVETHHANPTCNSCHRIFDPIGYGLGNFDAAGRWQDTDAGQTIDASGTLWDGTPFSGPAELRSALLKYRDSYYWNVTSVLLSYALGRQPFIAPGGKLYPFEQPAVREILREAKASNYTWSSILAGIAKSQPFQMENIVP